MKKPSVTSRRGSFDARSSLPKSWEIKKLRELSMHDDAIVSGPFGSNLQVADYRETGVPIIRLQNIGKGYFIDKNIKYIDEEKAQELKYHGYKPGDIALAKLGIPIGKTCIIPNDFKAGIITGDIVRIRSDKSIVDYDYLKYFLNTDSSVAQLTGNIIGTTRPRVNLSDVRDIEIPLPPLDDQIRIATVLTRAEKLIAKRKDSIKALDELLKSTFLKMFGDPLRNEKGWEEKQLSELCTKITDGEHGTVKRVESGFLYLMARNITRDNRIDLSEVSYISEADHKKIFSRCNAEQGDLLLVCVGATIGKVAIVPKMTDFSLARSVALIKHDRKFLNSEYVLHLFNSSYLIRQLSNRSNTAAQAGLYTGQIKQLKILLPPLSLQSQFAAIVEKVEALKTKYQQSLAELENLYGSLSQRAFKGELDLSGVRV